VLRRVTHPPKEQFDEYTTSLWSALCEAVGCLRISLLETSLDGLNKRLVPQVRP
jgi:hypothetical protein